MAAGFQHYVCGLCATPATEAGVCQACGAEDSQIKVVDGFLLEFPAHSIPCPGCGSTEKPLVFRGWVRLLALIYWVREGRGGGYVCKDCARTETTKALFYSALLGWWSIPSIFFYGWRATYQNWRSIVSAPAKPHEWGAIPAADFIADMRASQEEAFEEAEAEWILNETPLGQLNETQRGMVLGAADLYGLLEVSPSATVQEIHRAYRQRSKEAHPDFHNASREATELMMHLNQAWEILRSEQMREAYDWLQTQKDEEAVA